MYIHSVGRCQVIFEKHLNGAHRACQEPKQHGRKDAAPQLGRGGTRILHPRVTAQRYVQENAAEDTNGNLLHRNTAREFKTGHPVFPPRTHITESTESSLHLGQEARTVLHFQNRLPAAQQQHGARSRFVRHQCGTN